MKITASINSYEHANESETWLSISQPAQDIFMIKVESSGMLGPFLAKLSLVCNLHSAITR